MRVNFAHLREHSTSGGWVNFAVFDAKSVSGDSGNSQLLAQLTAQVRAQGLRVDQSALAFTQNGRVRFYGTDTLVKYLSRVGIPGWTHSIDV
ncbi:hypothetical protein INP77_10365 [Methylophilus sp. 13]|uniref:hypothetical protein n=1 Tax=Methylophilus sp. 13 TaxID=2781018 RepID=UPI00188E2948|nr:hypothetical protein [Methylophilus sp. 13]MBF5039893.1 hypothetical protein [Methylophilus sp. 13]